MILSPWYFSTRFNEAFGVVYPRRTMQQHGRGEMLSVRFFVNTDISSAGDAVFNL